MHRLWTALRFVVFLPIAVLLATGYLLAGVIGPEVFLGKGLRTIHRWYRSWWQWVTGEMSTLDLIR